VLCWRPCGRGMALSAHFLSEGGRGAATAWTIGEARCSRGRACTRWQHNAKTCAQTGRQVSDQWGGLSWHYREAGLWIPVVSGQRPSRWWIGGGKGRCYQVGQHGERVWAGFSKSGWVG
jgi:hypothetical protein